MTKCQVTLHTAHWINREQVKQYRNTWWYSNKPRKYKARPQNRAWCLFSPLFFYSALTLSCHSRLGERTRSDTGYHSRSYQRKSAKTPASWNWRLHFPRNSSDGLCLKSQIANSPFCIKFWFLLSCPLERTHFQTDWLSVRWKDVPIYRTEFYRWRKSPWTTNKQSRISFSW